MTRHRLFLAVAAAALAIVLGSAAMWGVSLFRLESATIRLGFPQYLRVVLISGVVQVSWNSYVGETRTFYDQVHPNLLNRLAASRPHSEWLYEPRPEHRRFWWWYVAGFGYNEYWSPGPGSSSVILVCVPLWAIMLLVGVVSTISWRKARRWRHRAGCCRACGYDLRGGQTDTCPECGEPIAPVAT